MEIAVPFISSQSFVVAFSFTFLCCLLALLAVRFSSGSWKSSSDGRKTASDKSIGSFHCSCSCNGAVVSSEAVANGGSEEMPVVVAAATAATTLERQSGASMMEQLVPEITTHALSYLDYPSLCRLSMTNSLMRKAANDDNAWKALYHKDFTVEQDGVRPANGWKAYYAATRAIVNINAEFFNIIRERSLQAMSHFWLNADYVKCIHASGEIFTGYNAVMESWQIVFNWVQQADNFHVRDVRARVLTDMAWVTMKTYVDMHAGPYNVTNVFEYHDGRWYIVHHHWSVMLVDADVDQQIMHP